MKKEFVLVLLNIFSYRRWYHLASFCVCMWAWCCYFYEIKGGGHHVENKVQRSLCRKTKKKQYACFEKLVKTGKIVRLQIHFDEFFCLKQYIINGVFPVNIGICCVNKQLDG